jgi:hypothetical protein
MAYATLDQVYDAMPQLTRGEHDAVLGDYLDRATKIVDRALGFSFSDYGAAADKDVRAVGGQYLELPYHQADSVTAVYEVLSKAADYESTSEITDYEELPDGRLWRALGWYQDVWYRVTGVWGYGEAPDDVVEVTIRVAVNIWRGRDSSQWANSIGVEGQGSVPYNRALSWAERDILAGVRADYEGVIHA